MTALLYVVGVLSAIGAVNLLLWLVGSRWRFGWFERESSRPSDRQGSLNS